MNVTPEQKERFKNMVRDFATKNGLQYRFHEKSYVPECIGVHLRRTYDVVWGEWYIRFDEVRSLTEAGTALFTDASIKFGLGPAANVATKASVLTITNVIYNPPATVVFWSDGSKTVVKCSENDEFDPEKGLAMAISKKMLGNQGNYYNEFKKWAAKCEVESLYPKLEMPAFGISWEPPEPQKLADIIRERLASIFGRGVPG